MKWAAPADWGSIDLTGHCRVWTQDQDGVQRRMTNRSKVWIIEAAALNHLEGRTPRLLFAQAWDAATVTACDSSPLMTARWIDNKVNSRDRTVRVLALPRDSDVYSTNVAADIYTNAASASNAVFPEAANVPTFPTDAIYRTFKVAKGGSSNAVVTEKISATNGLPIIDICCQEDQVNTLDTALDHDLVFAYSATPGAPIVTGLLEDLRAKFHRLRMGQNRLMCCFLGLASGGTYSMLSATGAGGFYIVNQGSNVNLLDQTVTTKSATTPGMSMPGYRSGVGLAVSTGVIFYFLAMRGPVGGTSTITIIGPDHIAPNQASVDVTATSATWYQCGPVQLNTEATETDATNGRNKIDIHGSALNNPETGDGKLSVFSILGFTVQT